MLLLYTRPDDDDFFVCACVWLRMEYEQRVVPLTNQRWEISSRCENHLPCHATLPRKYTHNKLFKNFECQLQSLRTQFLTLAIAVLLMHKL
jgi:hypothetical protein